MQIVKVIKGIKYTIEVPFNQEIAHSMAQSYNGYRIEAITEAYSTKLYKVNTSAFLPKETKLIGSLVYDTETDTITLYKYVDNNIHKFLKADSYGINNEIISRLRAKDKILISDGKTNYKISVRKALSVGQYLQFDKYEKQLFIPISEFKTSEVKKRQKRKVKKS